MKRTFVPTLLFPWVYVPVRDAALGKGAGGGGFFFLEVGGNIYLCLFLVFGENSRSVCCGERLFFFFFFFGIETRAAAMPRVCAWNAVGGGGGKS